MGIEVRLPKLSEEMESGTLVRWLKREGESVAAGEVIAEIETEKAQVEIEAPASGVLARLVVAEGSEKIPVGELLAVIEAVGGELPARQPALVAPPPSVALSQPATAPSEVRAAPERKEFSNDRYGREQLAGESSGTGVAATPLARAMARAAGLDLSSLAGGSSVVVTRDTVEKALGLPRKDAQAPWTGEEDAGEPTDGRLQPHNTVRKVIAARLAQAKQTIPHFYLSVDCDVTIASGLIERLNRDEPQVRLTLTGLVVKTAAAAIARVPAVNAQWTPNGLLMREANIAVGVATPAGLVAPVIRRPASKSLGEIATELASLAERAKASRLGPQDSSGGTFTISNLGMYGVDSLFPIITLGQACVLGVGAVRECPVVRDGVLAVGKVMTVTLSADHRAIDGHQGAEFLRAFKKLTEEPARMLL